MRVIDWHEHDTKEASLLAIGHHWMNEMRLCVEDRCRCDIALAGGNTPKRLYQWLSTQPFDWNKVTATLTDERWFPEDHPDSNQNMIKHNLLANHAAELHWIPLINEAHTAEEGQKITDELLQKRMPDLDLVLLGMGDDGHIASIFPAMLDTEDLVSSATVEKCLPTVAPTGQPRISLTLSYILTAKRIFLLIQGESKKRTLEQAMKNKQHQIPVASLIQHSTFPVQIYWSR